VTHYRTPGSPEAVLLEVLQLLPPVAVHSATNKKVATFYRVSNPENELGLHLDDAAALDAALLARGERARFAHLLSELTQSALTRMGGEKSNGFCIDAGLRRITGELGDLARAVDDMLAGPQDLQERRRVAKEAQDVIDAAMAIRDAATPKPAVARAAE